MGWLWKTNSATKVGLWTRIFSIHQVFMASNLLCSWRSVDMTHDDSCVFFLH